MRLPVLLIALLLVACTSTPPTVRLPSYDAAIAMADVDNPRMPKLFARGDVDDSIMFELIPYALWAWTRDGGNLESGTKSATHRLIREMPDAVICGEGRTEIGGVTTSHMLLGVSTGSVATSTPTEAIAYREAPAVLPFRWDLATTMVRKVHDAAKCGDIIEGDAVAYVSGIDITTKNLAATGLPFMWIQARPGSKVAVEWIRPGKGRMTGEVELIANPRAYRSSRDSFTFSMGEVRKYVGPTGMPYWSFYDPFSDDATGWLKHGR
jgi:hypothetical protein